MTRVFITGGTGFVGRNLVEFLVRQYPDLQLDCLVRDLAKADWMQTHPQIKICHGDITKPLTYQRIIREADYILHTAALVGLKNGQAFYDINVEGTKALLHNCRGLENQGKFKRLVFTSSISAVDRPLSLKSEGAMTELTPPLPNTDYGKSKLISESLIRQSKLPYTILRPSYIYGPHPRLGSSMDRLIYDVAQNKPYTQIPFPGRASEIHVQDLADCIWHSAQSTEAKNQIFFAATPEPAKIAEVFPMVASALNISYNPRVVSPEAMERLQVRSYLKYPAQPLVRVMFEDSFYCSTEKLTELTHWHPKLTLEEGIARTVYWYRQQGYL